MAKDEHKFDAEALARIGKAMTEAYENKGQAMLEDAMESKYLQQEDGGVLSDFLGTLSKDPRGWRGERSPREYGIPSPMDAHFGGPREQLEYQQSQEFDASRSRIQAARDEAEAKQLDILYKEQEKEQKKRDKLYKKQLKEQAKIAKAQAREDEKERKAEAVRQFGETARGRSPLALEDFDNMGQFQKARKMRETYIEEMAGDYAGAPRDSPLAYHERMQLEKSEREADFMRRGDDYLDQPGGYLSLGEEFGGDPRGGQRRQEYLGDAEMQWGAIEDEIEADFMRRGDDYLDQPGGYLSLGAEFGGDPRGGQRRQEYLREAGSQFSAIEDERDAKLLDERMTAAQKDYERDKMMGEAQRDYAFQKKALVDRPLRREDFNNLEEFQRARKIREKSISERVGDYAGAGPDSYMAHHKRVQYDKKKAEKLDKTMMEAQKDYRKFQADRETKGDAMLKDKFKADFNSLKNQYSRLGTKIRQTVDPIERNELTKRRNQLISDGKKAAENAGMDPDDMIGQFPYVDEVDDMERYVDVASQAFKGKDRASKVAGELFGQAGEGSFYERGSLFRGTSYASTGAINGVMKALAGIFILFVFIGVFYLVFGPIYDSLIHNFTLIVSVDGDPTLGGKDIPTLFDNVAKVVLVWVPLIVFAGALYKLTALVFEREVGTRTNEETEWDMLAAGEDSVDLDAGSDPSVFEAYGGGY